MAAFNFQSICIVLHNFLSLLIFDSQDDKTVSWSVDVLEGKPERLDSVVAILLGLDFTTGVHRVGLVTRPPG